ncbi:PrsW family intramembrane metalloprotease [Kitasatospora sp. NBC_00240]|uniref:PrsW family glutamic-type intramembrane protease n=1 Tax=Kitasatospora sp. NBC_00240 TaxID=2903567 RepID=UPI00225B3F96|nr:PrsW family glutamic-type intramembrane protease [Kitasatospora sp. NBC_00240]MCX5215203.1 PrsW family intramembrane metalloprotease [Kitasatospora sp. NBC_00240]
MFQVLRNDRAVTASALLIARGAIALYLVELVGNLTRPRLLPDEPSLSIFYKMPSDLTEMPGFSDSFEKLMAMPSAVFWTVLAGIAAGVLIQLFVAVTRQPDRRAALLTWVTLGLLLLPFGLIPLVVVVEYFPLTLACLPSTAFVLLLLRSGVRFARVPLAALLAAFGWGALIVFGLGRAYTGLAFATISGYMIPKDYLHPAGGDLDLSQFLRSMYRTIDLVIVHLGVVNALVVAAGVLMLLLLFRHRITDTVTGLTLGAAVGLGYSFVESILFIKIYGSFGSILGTTGGFEYWIRQSIGLLGGQVAFGAVVGAGLTLAARSQRRVLVASAALVAAIGGATATETLSGWLSGRLAGQVDTGSALDTLVVSPLLWLLPQLPFIALAVMLLVLGLRERAVTLRAAAASEAATGHLAITPAEELVLISPTLRLWALVRTWRRHGRGTALHLHRLQTAQLDLASWRAQNDPDLEAQGDELRTRVLQLKNVRAVVGS